MFITVESDGTEVVYRQDLIGGSAEWLSSTQTPLWGYAGDFSVSIARFAVFREAAR